MNMTRLLFEWQGKQILTLVFLFGAILSVDDAHGQSLFDRLDKRMINPYANYVARDVGDLLVVMINESTDIENSDVRTMGTTGSSSVSGSIDYSVGGGLGSGAGVGDLGSSTNANRDFSGDSNTRSEHAFSDRFAVTVLEVLPNGNLIVSGRRSVTVRGDLRTLYLTGVVRQFDVLPSNVVSSQLVADLKIGLDGEGESKDFSRQGWLGRKLNKAWPF